MRIVKRAGDDDPKDSRGLTLHGSYHGRKAEVARGNLRRMGEKPAPAKWSRIPRRP